MGVMTEGQRWAKIWQLFLLAVAVCMPGNELGVSASFSGCKEGKVLSIKAMSDGSSVADQFSSQNNNLPIEVVGWDDSTLTYNVQNVWDPTDGVLNMMATVFVDVSATTTDCLVQLDVAADEVTSYVTTTCDVNTGKAIVDLYVHDDSLFDEDNAVDLPESCTQVFVGGDMVEKVEKHTVGYRFEMQCSCPTDTEELAMAQLDLIDEVESANEAAGDVDSSKDLSSPEEANEEGVYENSSNVTCGCGCGEEDCHCHDGEDCISEATK